MVILYAAALVCYEPSISFTPLINIYGNPFEQALLPVGGKSFSGIALTPAYQTGDGYLEQVFTNIVVASLPDSPETFWLLPVPGIIGIPNTSPVIQQYDLTDNMVFVAVQNEHGIPRSHSTG